MSDLESQRNELLNKVDDLTEQLEHTLKVSDHTSSKLAQRAADVQTAKQTRVSLPIHYQLPKLEYKNNALKKHIEVSSS